ncbi:Conserved_hypothetical protein [Hexamita inflata]|uniref:Reverse transcriptase domain-containing protein n=1 Tax=Hexamita inflata TaxID=28002 RepID=A0AA86V3Y2_9EUKA|nr:Conserved hypothetical protein [Hexamita inflata]
MIILLCSIQEAQSFSECFSALSYISNNAVTYELQLHLLPFEDLEKITSQNLCQIYLPGKDVITKIHYNDISFPKVGEAPVKFVYQYNQEIIVSFQLTQADYSLIINKQNAMYELWYDVNLIKVNNSVGNIQHTKYNGTGCFSDISMVYTIYGDIDINVVPNNCVVDFSTVSISLDYTTTTQNFKIPIYSCTSGCQEGEYNITSLNFKTITIYRVKKFNETQLETLLYGMETQLVPMQTQLYLCGLIQAQNCRETASYNLVQGNNLSSLCFSYAIQPILEELRKKYRISCYADDIIIEIGQDTEKDVIQFATNLFSKYGFTINEKKCFSTANDNVITFDGINVSSTENDPRLHTSKKLIQTADEIYSLVEQLLERGLGRSQTLGIFLVSLIPKINWALRIEDYVEETIKDYNKIDEVMAQTFYMITNPRQFSEEDFMGEKRQVTINITINILEQMEWYIDGQNIYVLKYL